MESACCKSHKILLISINFCNISLFIDFEFSWEFMMSAKQAIALDICFCLFSMPLSRLTAVSVIAALISKFSLGASSWTQFFGSRYFLIKFLRSSLLRPSLTMCNKRFASSLRISGPYLSLQVGSSPKISRISVSRSGTLVSWAIGSSGGRSLSVLGPGWGSQLLSEFWTVLSSVCQSSNQSLGRSAGVSEIYHSNDNFDICKLTYLKGGALRSPWQIYVILFKMKIFVIW